MNCKKCGQPIPKDLNYCPICETNEGERFKDIKENPGKWGQSSLRKRKIKYLLCIYSIIILLFILLGIIVSLSNLTSFAYLGFSFFLNVRIETLMIILSSILTFRFINQNFNQSNEPISSKVIMNVISTYALYLFIVNVLFETSNFVAYLTDNTKNYFSTEFDIYIHMFVLPLIIIPISYILNKDNKVNKKEIWIIIVLFILSGIVENFTIIVDNLKSVLFEKDKSYMFLLEAISFTLLQPVVMFIPMFIVSLLNDNYQKIGQEKKGLLRATIICGISVLLYIGSNNFPRDKFKSLIDESRAKPDQSSISEFTYCVMPYKTKKGLYYRAYNSSICWSDKSDLSNTNDKYQQNLYYVDTKDLAVTSYVTNISYIYDFYGQTNNLYYFLKGRGLLYELNKDGTFKRIIPSRKTDIIFYHDNKIYYYDWGEHKNKMVDINTYQVNEIQGVNLDKVIFAINEYIYYLEYIYSSTSNNKWQLNRYNIETKKSEVIYNRDIIDLINNGIFYLERNYFHIEGNELYFIDFAKRKEDFNYIYKFNLETERLQKNQILYKDENVDGYQNRARMLGLYNDDLYYIVKDDDYEKNISIHKINLTTNEVEMVIDFVQVYITDEDENYNQKKHVAELIFNNIAIIDEYLYYSNYGEDGGKIYRLNLLNGLKEKLNNDNNSVFFDAMDGYVYYITNDYINKTNSFYRIKDMKRETIIATTEENKNNFDEGYSS